LGEGISERARRVLREVGLTDYETRAYLTLLRMGAATASEISENGEIPYSKIYETLNSLERKGWIETQTGRPKRYYPKSPSEAFKAARLRIENTMKSWEHVIREEIQPIYDRREIRERPDIWILRGERGVLSRLRDMIEGSREELMIAIPPLARHLIEESIHMLRKIWEKRVKLFILVSEGFSSHSLKALSEIAEVKVRDHLFGGGIISDGREAILMLGEEKPALVIWSDHTELVKFAREYFQYLWNTAESTIKKAI